MAAINVHPPNSEEPSFSPAVFPYDAFMGTWQVVATTLPLWKNRKNVRISYSPLEDGTPPSKAFLDTVEYNGAKDAPGTTASKLVGVDTNEIIKGKTVQDSGNGAQWKWRGSGWLKLITSQWQVLGYHIDTGDDRSQDWVVTYFSSTLFTPAGLDVYARDWPALGEEKLEEIISACKENPNEEIKNLAKLFFHVARD